MMNQYKTMKRKELYDAVWSTPISKLAKEYGISDRGLTKVCERHTIPTPPLGYWAKFQNGHEVTKPPFTGDPDVRISFMVSPQNPMLRKTKDLKGLKKQLELDEQISNIKFDDTLTKASPVIKSFLNLYESSKEHNNRLFLRPQSYEKHKISKENFNRAVLILNNIEKITNLLGGTVHFDTHGLALNLWGGSYEIGLTEKIITKVIGKKRQGSGDWAWETDIFDYEGSNLFSLKFIHGWRMSRGSFNDGVKQRIEDILPKFFRQIRSDRNIQEEKEQEEQFKAMRLRAKNKREAPARDAASRKQKMRDDLQVQIQEWKKAEEIRQYLTSFMKRALKNKGKIKSIKELNDYIRFVKGYADDLDPLRSFL